MSNRHGPAVAIAIALVALCAPAANSAGERTVDLRGTAYEFNNVDVLLEGAQIRVAEFPRLRATTKRNGTYRLSVPDGAQVTPYITAPGYHSIHLQTFTTDGEDLDRVNFQTPTEDVYRALAALLEVPLTPEAELRECGIVSTFSTRNVRDVSFSAFTGYGAHGIAGATAFATPALPSPVYFNEQVIPDRAQERSSEDGGVIWTEVPAGRYRIRAAHPDTEFASFVATCAPGRVVNANPTWGLHELGKRMPALISARWSGARPLSLVARRLPSDAAVTVSCSGRGCPFSSRRVDVGDASRVDILDELGSAARRIGAGQMLSVRVTARVHDGKVVSWRLRDGTAPKASTSCVPLGYTKARRRC